MPVQAITSLSAYPGYGGVAAGNAHARHTATAPGSRPAPLSDNIPVERVIEGELLEKKASVSGPRPDDLVTRLLQSGKYNSQSQSARVQSSAVIAAYLSMGDVGGAGIIQRIDLYV